VGEGSKSSASAGGRKRTLSTSFSISVQSFPASLITIKHHNHTKRPTPLSSSSAHTAPPMARKKSTNSATTTTNSPAPRHPHPHLFARLNYLHQSAHLLLTSGSANLSRNLVSTARTVAKKAVIRFDPSIKRTWCRRCDAVLVPGVSCEHRVENLSRGGRKAWADVLIVRCWGCGCLKRFPVGSVAHGKGRDEGGGMRGGEYNIAGEGKEKEEDTGGNPAR